MSAPPVVVLTPVKNETWILDRFLAATSTFADEIVIADQGSTDGSLEIARRHPKVHLVHNPGSEYDEASRQELLLATARERHPGRKVLLALDADEIVAADAPGSPGWQTMLGAEPGTVLLFEKPDLYETPHRCIRHAQPWPLGYVDDGAPHAPGRIHSVRVPQPPGAPRLEIPEVKILHFAMTRPRAQRAKMRYYSVLEALHGTNHLPARRHRYAPGFDWRVIGTLETSPDSWFEGWSARGIDLLAIRQPRYTWHDHEVLRAFDRYGERRFWLEPIWDQDWELCRRSAAPGSDEPARAISGPPLAARLVGATIDLAYRGWLLVRTRLSSPRPR